MRRAGTLRCLRSLRGILAGVERWQAGAYLVSNAGRKKRLREAGAPKLDALPTHDAGVAVATVERLIG